MFAGLRQCAGNEKIVDDYCILTSDDEDREYPWNVIGLVRTDPYDDRISGPNTYTERYEAYIMKDC